MFVLLKCLNIIIVRGNITINEGFGFNLGKNSQYYYKKQKCKLWRKKIIADKKMTSLLIRNIKPICIKWLK